MLEVAILQRRLANYRLPLYEGVIAGYPDIRLTVYCGHRDEGKGTSGIPMSGDDPDFVCRVKNTRMGPVGRKLVFQAQAIRKVLGRGCDVAVFEGSLSVISNTVLLALRHMMRAKNIIWLKGWPNADGESPAKRIIKRWYLRLADGFIVYGESSRDALARYRVDDMSITVVQNTVAVGNLLEQDARKTDSPGHDPTIEAMLTSDKQIILNIGRLVSKKAVSDLIEAYAILSHEGMPEETLLVIAGAGPIGRGLRKSRDSGELQRDS